MFVTDASIALAPFYVSNWPTVRAVAAEPVLAEIVGEDDEDVGPQLLRK
jgi:hypothetical protein